MPGNDAMTALATLGDAQTQPGCAVVDRTGRLVQIDEQFTHITGVAPTADGQPAASALPALAALVATALAGQAPPASPPQPGAARPWVARCQPVRASSGYVLGAEILVEPADAPPGQNSDAPHAQLLQAILGAVPTGIALLDGVSLRVRWANPAYRTFLDEPHRSGDIAGLHLSAFIPRADASGVTAIFEQVARTRQTYVNPEYEHVGFARGPTYWRWCLLPLDVPGRSAPDLLMVVSEVSEQVAARKRVEALARQNQAHTQRLQTIIDSMSEGVIITDAAGNVIEMNRAALRIHGFGSGEQTRRHLHDFSDTFVLSPLDGPALATDDWPIARLLRGEEFTDLAVRLRRRDTGREWIASYSGATIRDAAGAVALAVLTARDITDHQAAQEALRTSERRYRELADAMPLVVWITDAAGAATYFNARWVDFTGMPIAQSLGYGWHAALHPDDVEPCKARWEESVRSGRPYEVEYRWRHAADGSYRWQLGRAFPIYGPQGRIDYWVGSSTDIDDLKRAEQEQQKFVTLVEHSTDFIGIATPDQRVVFINRAGRRMVGLAEQAPLNGAAATDYTRRDDWHLLRRALARTLRDGAWAGELRLLNRQSGAEVPVLCNIFSIPDPHTGRTLALAAVARDITERKRVEQERHHLLLRETEARARAEQAAERIAGLQAITAALAEARSLEQVADVVLNQGLLLLGSSVGLVALLDEHGDEFVTLRAVGTAAERASAPRFPLATPIPIAEAVRSGQAVVLGSREELLARFPLLARPVAENMAVPDRGALVALPLQVHGRAIGGLGLSFPQARQFTGEDIALLGAVAQQCAQAIERARLYEAEQQAAAAAAAAVHVRDQFLSVAAHELKTPLTSLIGHAQLFERRVRREQLLPERLQGSVQAVLDQAARMRKLIDMLLDISRLQRGQLSISRAPLDLTALVRAAAEEVGPTLRQHRLRLDLPDGPLLISGDELRLEQVLSNLLGNAVKYSPEGGTIGLRLSEAGGQALLSVSDEGIGIPAPALPRLFERFFRADNATAYQISGLGVGLYVVHEIITLHDGSLTVSSLEGQGSTFTAWLPLLRGA